VATLGLARRLDRNGSDAARPGNRLVRDLCWLTEGALGDVALARAWPGLLPDLLELRRQELAARPEPERRRAPERAIESWIRSVLETPPARLPRLLDGLDPDVPREEVVRFVTARAPLLDAESGYRGFTPVVHWGACHPALDDATSRPAGGVRPRGRRPRRGATLPRPLQRRAPEPEDGQRPGPFVLPFADPHLTVDDPGGIVRPPDRGHDEDLEALAEELARLEGLPVVRDDADVREVLEDGGAAHPTRPHRGEWEPGQGRVWLYPEWDAARDAYHDPGCRVRELRASADDGGWAEAALARHGPLLTRLRRQFEALRARRERLRRQPEGDDIDISGWVDDWADRLAGRPPGGRVYTQERLRRRDVAVTLLLDASGSTESWLSGRQRIIDVVKEAALAFGEALAMLGDRFAVQAFSGQSAADVRVRVVKRFDEPHGPAVRSRVGALEPDAFTRLGGALRHATLGLGRERAGVRLLLVLTDGKPQDEDGYEGDYGVEDVRQAVAEAQLQGVRVFGITVDREGPDYLPRLFGPHGYTVIWNAEALPERLPAIYGRLTAVL